MNMIRSKSASYAKGGRGTRDEEGLTARQREFVFKYLTDPKCSASGAAKAAGYSGHEQAANRLMRIPAVRAALARRLRPRIEELEISADRVLQGLAELAFANILDFGHVTPDGQFCVDLLKVDRVAAGALTELITESYVEGCGENARIVTRTKVKLADRRPALETLARHLHLLGTTLPTYGEQPVNLIIMHAPRRASDGIAHQTAGHTASS